jgi:uncharacterized membrane protein HdeD (DUF308 family)
MTYSGSSTPSDPIRDSMRAALARNWWALALRGVIGIVFGLYALFATAATILSLVFVLAVYLVIDGDLAIINSVRSAQMGGAWGLLLLEGLVDILMGVIAFLFPAAAVTAFVLVLAAWALVSGVLMVMAAFRLDAAHGRLWLGLGGVASLVFGVALVVAPWIGAFVVTWWLGAYALVFGIALLIFAFQLRRRHTANRV